MFHYILVRVKAKTQGWNKKFLSQGGKEVLLKSVALAMPIYSMNVYKLPKKICEEINNILNRFWWSKGNDTKGMHWFAWNRLSCPKNEGGLGFRDLEGFNSALLGKQSWRILQKPQCLMARVLKGRYFHDTNILNAKQGANASFIWKSILHGRDLLKKGLRYVIGDGTMVNAWLDPWLPQHPPIAPRKKNESVQNCMVSDLMNGAGTDWNETKIREYVHPEDIDKILRLKLSPSGRGDLLGWHYTKEGFYTVKSAYWLSTHLHTERVIIPPPGDINLKKQVWRLSTAPKIKHFIWRLLSGALATGATLKYRHISQFSDCKRCCAAEETTNHLFFECSYARSIWRASGIPSRIITDTTSSLETKMTALLFLTTSSRTRQQHLPLWILWRIWKSRNTLCFQHRNIPWEVTLNLAKTDTQEWTDAVPLRQRNRCNNATIPIGVTPRWTP